jgi:isocitrate dehydrogenase
MGTEDFGLKYLTKEETIKKHEGVSEDWPKEVFEEQRAVVWTDSSFASQEDQKSQGAMVLTHCMAPVYWKCA